MLNLGTNRIMETCEVSFDETMPCSSTVFECAGDEEMAETLFVEEEDEEGEENVDHVHDGERVPSTSITTTFDGAPLLPRLRHVNKNRHKQEWKLLLRGRQSPSARHQGMYKWTILHRTS